MALGLGTILVTNAQIATTKPSHLKAENRRALRDARHTDAPNKATHLTVTKDQLKRGNSDAPQPEGADELRYNKEGIAIPPKRGLLGNGRKKK